MPESWNIGWADDIAYSVTVDDSARYVLTGFTTGAGNGGKELSLLIMGEYNDFRCSLTNGSPQDDVGYYAVATKDGGYVIIGCSEGLGIGLTNIYVLKIGHDCSFIPVSQQITPVEEIKPNNPNAFCNIYPNLSDGKFNVTYNGKSNNRNYDISVIDLMGKTIFSDRANLMDSTPFLIDISDKACGVYFITISNNEQYSAFKVVKYNN